MSCNLILLLFSCSNLSALAWELLHVDSFFKMPHQFLSTYYFWCKMFSAPIFPAPALEPIIFPRSPCFFYWWMVSRNKIWVLSVLNITRGVLSLLLDPFCQQGICRFINTYICIYFCVYPSVCILKTMEFTLVTLIPHRVHCSLPFLFVIFITHNRFTVLVKPSIDKVPEFLTHAPVREKLTN